MNIAATMLVFVGIPVAVALIVTMLVYGGRRGRMRRYRPGRAYDFAPVWFVSAADRLSGSAADAVGDQRLEVHAAGGRHEITRAAARPAMWPGVEPDGGTGGASDRW